MAALGERTYIVVAGCGAHVCVLQTELDILDLPQPAFVARGALGSRQLESKKTGITRGKGAVLTGDSLDQADRDGLSRFFSD